MDNFLKEFLDTAKRSVTVTASIMTVESSGNGFSILRSRSGVLKVAGVYKPGARLVVSPSGAVIGKKAGDDLVLSSE